MAYPTGANLNTLLLQQLNFRTTGNYPISSLYTLYANGQGQTYWSNSVNPIALSTLASTIYNSYVELSTTVSKLDASSIISTISSFEVYTYSSFSTVFYYQDILLAESTNLNYAFLSTANSFQVQLNSYYQSTLNVCYSTVNSLAGFSSFQGELSSFILVYQTSLSTMSTGIGLQAATTSTLLIGLINYGLYSTSVWTAGQISSLSTIMATKVQLNTVSTTINYALLSTSTGLESEISSTNVYITDVSTYAVAVNNNLITTTASLTTQINTLNGEFIGLSTAFISLSGEVSTFIDNTTSTVIVLTNDVSTLTTATAVNTTDIYNLNQQVSVITTSSILEGIYSTFIQLETYTVELINSTNTAAEASFAALQLSTTIYLQSTNTGLQSQFTSTFTSTFNKYYSTLTSTFNIYISTFTSTANTYFSTFTSTFNTYFSTLTSTTTASISVLSTQISTIAANANLIVSSINGVQLIRLNSSIFTGTLDFVNYRNFTVQVNNIANIAGSSYSVSFNPTAISSIALQQGVIMLDISTNTQAYTQNNNKLALNFNSWNVINQPTYSQFPMLANSAYRMEYIYSVYNNSVYTSLVNIWPYQNTFNLTASSINSNLAIDPSFRNIYSTGTVVQFAWQVYLFSTFTSAFSSFVNIDIAVNGASVQSFGPYSYTQSTVQIAIPSGAYPAGSGLYVSTLFTSYIVGEPAKGSTIRGVTYYR